MTHDMVLYSVCSALTEDAYARRKKAGRAGALSTACYAVWLAVVVGAAVRTQHNNQVVEMGRRRRTAGVVGTCKIRAGAHHRPTIQENVTELVRTVQKSASATREVSTRCSDTRFAHKVQRGDTPAWRRERWRLRPRLCSPFRHERQSFLSCPRYFSTANDSDAAAEELQRGERQRRPTAPSAARTIPVQVRIFVACPTTREVFALYAVSRRTADDHTGIHCHVDRSLIKAKNGRTAFWIADGCRASAGSPMDTCSVLRRSIHRCVV